MLTKPLNGLGLRGVRAGISQKSMEDSIVRLDWEVDLETDCQGTESEECMILVTIIWGKERFV